MNRFVINDLCTVVAEDSKDSECGQRQDLQSGFLPSEVLNATIYREL